VLLDVCLHAQGVLLCLGLRLCALLVCVHAFLLLLQLGLHLLQHVGVAEPHLAARIGVVLGE
jgi:hypothetical protein